MDLSSVVACIVTCVVTVGRAQVAERRPSLPRRLFGVARAAAEVVEPSGGGVVVVRAGVGDRRARVVVRQEAGRLRIGPERELEQLDPREPEPRAQRLHLRRDHPEILGDERQLAERGGDRPKKPRAGPGPPAALHRGRLSGRDRPVARVADEVIEADGVEQRQRRPEAGDPPGEPGGAHLRPAVERVAPALAGGAEVVGRHAGHQRRLAGVVEIELMAVQPDVGAVVRQEDRQVADEADPARVGVLAQRLPVAEEAPLHESGEVDLVGQRLARNCASAAASRSRSGAGQRVHWTSRRGSRLDRAVEREVLQPVPRLFGEAPKVGVVGACRPRRR